MRFVIYGGGAIGGVIGGRLHQHSHDVVLIARDTQLKAVRENGLRIESPDGTTTVNLPVVEHPSRLAFTDDDVIVLTMKAHDTGEALAALSGTVPAATPVVCAQNGVEGERQALRVFPNVYGVAVMCPSAYLEPGVVQAYGSPATGVLDVGCYPQGVDGTVERLVEAFTSAGFESEAQERIRRFKYGKLLFNLGNAVEAIAGPEARKGPLVELARKEALLVYEAAGIDFDPKAHERSAAAKPASIGQGARLGGSSWQSLQRGLRRIETDYLNGEIVLLGRLAGVRTPVNETLQTLANELARNSMPPGSIDPDVLVTKIEEASRL